MNRTIFYSIDELHDGQTVARFLRGQGISHRVLVELKKFEDGLTVDGRPIRTIDRLRAGDRLRLCLYETDLSDTIPQADLPLSIIYEDEDLFIVDKPAGLAVHPSPQNRENTVANGLAALYALRGEPFVFRPIGRLDKNTSGLIVLAKNALSAGLLTDQAAQGTLCRTYLAVCTSELPPEGTIDAPIGRVDGSVIARTVRPDGVRAVTHFTRLAMHDGFSLAAVRLETGRTHQIRVHFAHLGYPLPGDFLYHPDFSRIERHALHAARLDLRQPVTGAPLSFFSPLPADLAAFFPGLPDIKTLLPPAEVIGNA